MSKERLPGEKFPDWYFRTKQQSKAADSYRTRFERRLQELMLEPGNAGTFTVEPKPEPCHWCKRIECEGEFGSCVLKPEQLKRDLEIRKLAEEFKKDPFCPADMTVEQIQGYLDRGKANRVYPMSRHEVQVTPEPQRCAWCDGHLCRSKFSAACHGYTAALAERLAAGANDCPEERESVRRWVDAQKPQRVCAECKARPLPDDGVTQLCGDCVGACRTRLQRANHPGNPSSSWEAWSTPTDEGP